MLQEALSCFAKIVKEAREVLEKVLPGKFNVRERVLLGQFAGIVERSKMISLSLRESAVSSGFVLARSQIELAVDIVNLARDSAYLKVIEKRALLDQKSLLDRADKARDDHLYLGKIKKGPDYGARSREVRSDLGVLEPKSGNQLATKGKKAFESAGLQDFYEGPYVLLSGHAHGRPSALFHSYFIEGAGGLEFVGVRPPHDEEIVMILDVAVKGLIGSIRAISSVFPGPFEAHLKNAEATAAMLSEIWKGVGDPPVAPDDRDRAS